MQRNQAIQVMHTFTSLPLVAIIAFALKWTDLFNADPSMHACIFIALGVTWKFAAFIVSKNYRMETITLYLTDSWSVSES